MKKSVFIFLLISCFSFQLKSQDTVVVQTLSFGDIVKRRGLWVFPDTTESYRKILMSYTLKCDAATTWDQYPCGEWDYLTYTTVHKHTGTYDSTATTAPLFKLGNLSPDTVILSSLPIYDYYLQYYYNIVYDNIASENDFTAGTGLSTTNYPFAASGKVRRAQYLWLASELTASGLTAGSIDRLKIDITSLGSDMNNLTIRIKSTTATSLNSMDNSAGFITVYQNNHSFVATGMNTIDLINAFNWDGSSNIIIEFSYENAASGTDNMLTADATAFNSGVVSTASNGYIHGMGNDYVIVPTGGFSNLSNEVTIAFWQYGDVSVQPENGTLFEGINAMNQRILNVHLPWSDGNVYWDAGLDTLTGGYDRIYKAAAAANYEGQWNHWAFTKNTVTGAMKIYLNGVQWHSGTGKDNPMNGIAQFKIGANFFDNNTYNGKIDEFTIWNKELSASTITDLVTKKVDASHADYGNLLYQFKFDETSGNVAVNEVNASLNATLVGMAAHEQHAPTELNEIENILTTRPTLTFVRGNYTSHLDSVMVTDSVLHQESSLWFYQVNGNYVVPFDTINGWLPSWSYTYTNGVITDSVWVNGTGTYVNDTLNYYAPPFEIIDNYEIGRFITPYGIGLSLGTNGTTWTYDVTDYEPVLHDTVDLSAGNTQELIDLKFIFIKGTPARDVVEINKVWSGNNDYPSYSYANLDNDISLSAQSVALNAMAAGFRIKTRITGHGHNSDTGNYPHCCEWKDNTHYLFVNGIQRHEWHVWQEHDCALNPVYPQGGTWPGAREGWCPGNLVKDVEVEITPYVSGNSVTVDYDITPVPTNNLGMGGGNYVMSMQLIQYGAPHFTNDAEVYDIISPTDYKIYSRKNPVCDDPVIVLRNGGSDTLTSVTITYQISGGMPLSYNWTGSLAFMEKTEVALPVNNGSFWTGDTLQNFIVTTSNPNGVADQNTDNDMHQSHFNLPPIYSQPFVFWLKTNNRPWENSYTIKDISGNVVMSRTGMTANTLYKDTVDLADGCYTFELLDESDDGLKYWADPAAGTGYLQMKQLNGSLIKTFQAEFGRTVFYTFAIGSISNLKEENFDPEFVIYPNPNNGLFTLQLTGVEGKTNIEVFNSSGQLIHSENMNVSGEITHELNLGNTSPGLYYVRVTTEDKSYTKKMIVE